MTLIPTYANPFEFDMLMLEPVHELMVKGIRIDQTKKAQLQQEAIDEWHHHQTILDSLFDVPINVESKILIPRLLYEDLGMTPRRKHRKITADEAALRSIMAEAESKIESLSTSAARIRWKEAYILCRQVLNIRRLRKQISSYLGLKITSGVLAGPVPFEDPDGRIRGTISVGGAETARFSHSKTLWDTGINLATVPRSVRSMFIPDDGYEFCEFDLERGESWIYAHLSEDPELLRIHYEGLDFHAETASTISSAFGDLLEVEWIIANKADAAYKIRFLGKKTNHASSYRMKAHKGTETVNNEADETGITCTIRDFKKAQALWKARYFMIESNWWPEIERQLSASKTLTTPYGRVHQFHDAWGDELFKTATAYVPQSTSVDYINQGYLRVYHKFQKTGAWDMNVLAQTHDSILVQYRVEDRDEAIPAIASELKSSLTIKGRTFSIPIDPSLGLSWGALNDYLP